MHSSCIIALLYTHSHTPHDKFRTRTKRHLHTYATYIIIIRGPGRNAVSGGYNNNNNNKLARDDRDQFGSHLSRIYYIILLDPPSLPYVPLPPPKSRTGTARRQVNKTCRHFHTVRRTMRSTVCIVSIIIGCALIARRRDNGSWIRTTIV